MATGVIVLTMSAFAALLVFALREVSRGLTADQILTFYVLPAGVVLALAALLRASGDTRVKAAILLTAIGIGIVGAEAALISGLYVQEARAGGALWDDDRTMFDALLELRDGGDHAYPTIPGNILVEWDLTLSTDSVSVHPLAPTPGGRTAVMCSEKGIPVVFRADRFGFNNPDEAWDVDAVDVALVGDSYTQGMCVQDADQVATRLRDHWSVLNLGARGAGPFQELGITREYAAPKRPSVVVWTYFEGNDLSDMSGETGRAWLLDYLDPEHTQELIARQPIFQPLFEAWLDSLVVARSFAGSSPPQPLASRLSGTPRLSTLRGLSGFGVLRPRRTSLLGPLTDVLERARRDVDGWGGHFVLAFMPAYRRYTTVVGEGLPGRIELRRFAEENGIPLIDLDSVFTATPDPKALWSIPGGHLSPEGYRLVADAYRASISSTLRSEARSGAGRR